MEFFYDILKMLIPAGLVLYLTYLLVRSFLQNQMNEFSYRLRQQSKDTIVPLRLQAYERVVLFLERIRINHLLSRIGVSQYSAEELGHIAIHEIRNELNHNLSQQVYMSHQAWLLVASTVEQTIAIINSTINELEKESSGIELVKMLHEKDAKNEENDLNNQAISYIKKEIQEIF